MPVFYRKTPKAAEDGCAAYLDVVWLHSVRLFYGALLLMDGKGQPQEFVHNALAAPSGFLWPDPKVRELGAVVLSHSLFDACQREPDLLICLPSLGSPEFCRTEITPSIPFAMVTPPEDETPAEWSWNNDPPSTGMRAHRLYQTLTRHGLRIAYPQTPWQEADDDSGTP